MDDVFRSAKGRHPMRRFSTVLLAISMIATGPVAAMAGQAKPAARTIDINATDDMKFSVTTITARPGEALHIRLNVVGKMPKVAMAHNFVLFTAATTAKQLNDFVTQAATKGPVTYIPEDMKALVLAYTPMGGAGQVVDVTFTAPKAPGSYPYLCSFAGHFLVGMKGTLVVK